MSVFGVGEPIKCTKLLVVEGPGDADFFDALLHNMGILDIDIRQVGGKGEFRKKFQALKQVRGFYKIDETPRITHLVVVRDKDSDNAFASVCDLLRNEELPVPDNPAEFSNTVPKVGIFIMPGDNVSGTMIEDLCLKTVEHHPVMPCVMKFVDCVEAVPEDYSVSDSKAKVQAFLSTQARVGLAFGPAAQKGYWDFESSAMAELKAFLGHLR